MALGDAEIHLREGAALGARAHERRALVIGAAQGEGERLPVQGRGGEQGRVHAALEPGRSVVVAGAHLVGRLRLVRYAGRCAIAQGDDGGELLAQIHVVGAVHHLVGAADPAGVQAERLGQQHELLAVVAHDAVELLALGPHEGQVVARR